MGNRSIISYTATEISTSLADPPHAARQGSRHCQNEPIEPQRGSMATFPVQGRPAAKKNRSPVPQQITLIAKESTGEPRNGIFLAA